MHFSDGEIHSFLYYLLTDKRLHFDVGSVFIQSSRSEPWFLVVRYTPGAIKIKALLWYGFRTGTVFGTVFRYRTGSVLVRTVTVTVPVR